MDQYNFDDIHARVPINRTAILRNGVHYIPKKKILVKESETPDNEVYAKKRYFC